MSQGPDSIGLLYSLKTGVVPREGVAEITVGRTEPLKRIRSVLRAIRPNRKSGVEFIEGDYGEGKSHLLSLIRQEALACGIAVATFAADFDSSALHRPKPVLRAVTRNLQLPTRPEIGLTPLIRNLSGTTEFRQGVEELYGTWNDPRTSARRSEAFWFWPPGLMTSVRDPSSVALLSRWMGGDNVPIAPVRSRIRDRCTPPQRMTVTNGDLPFILLGLANSLNALGYGGLVIIIDELENALSGAAAPTHRRLGAALLAQLSRSHGALLVIGAVTPAVRLTIQVDSVHGQIAPFWKRDFDAVLRWLRDDSLIRIQELSARSLVSLGERIITIHEEAFAWEVDGRLSGDALAWLAEGTAAGHRPVRSYVRTLVELLDVCQQDLTFRIGSPEMKAARDRR